MKTQAEPLVVRTSQWTNALQIDVVADDYKPPLRELAFDAPGRVRQDHRFHSHPRENTNGKRHVFCRISLIKMDAARSEEHTSELQSQSNLVCRLLLEKKKSIDYCICMECHSIRLTPLPSYRTTSSTLPSHVLISSLVSALMPPSLHSPSTYWSSPYCI